MEDTKQRILEKSLELFSAKGYDAVSVGEIAKAVGIKAPWWTRTILHAILLEAVLLPLAHNWGFWYNTLDGLIYGTFILAAKVMWHLIDFGQSFYMAAALNEQIRKRKREEIQKEGSNNG